MALPAQEPFTGSAIQLADPPWISFKTGFDKDGAGLGQLHQASVDNLVTWDAATDTFPNDQYSQVVAQFTGPGNGSAYIYLIARVTGTYAAGTFYWFWTDGGSDTVLNKVVGGAVTSIATANATTFTSADVFKLECIGTAIKVYKNGTAFITVTDSAATSGQPGVGGWSNVSVSTVKVDDWIADAAGATDTLMGMACL